MILNAKMIKPVYRTDEDGVFEVRKQIFNENRSQSGRNSKCRLLGSIFTPFLQVSRLWMYEETRGVERRLKRSREPLRAAPCAAREAQVKGENSIFFHHEV